jgi:hypothetical protein
LKINFKIFLQYYRANEVKGSDPVRYTYKQVMMDVTDLTHIPITDPKNETISIINVSKWDDYFWVRFTKKATNL